MYAGTRAPVKVLDFMTGADVAKAEQEGEVVYYGHDSESGISTLLDAFKKDFPKIKTSYVRLQTGALYAKLTSERSANRFLVDVVQFSELAPPMDLQKKGGYELYVSPETAAYKPEYQSNPAGGSFTGTISGRVSPARSRGASIRGRSSSIDSPRATTRYVPWPSTPATFSSRKRGPTSSW